jgi:hypothetical protein
MHYDQEVNPFIFGRLPPGDAVTIRLVAYPGGAEVTPVANVCTETAIPGHFVWSLAALDRNLLPANPATLLYVMRGATGVEFSGKIIIGSYPEWVRRTYFNVQTLM